MTPASNTPRIPDEFGYRLAGPRERAPYLATIEIEVWEWEHRQATEVFKNLCDDIAKLSHRHSSGSHGFPPPLSMKLEVNR